MNTYFFKYTGITCISLALATALGAFGAHALKELLDDNLRSIYDTASRYHFYNSLGLGLLTLLLKRSNSPHVKWLLGLNLLGMGIFCGSLYLLSTRFLLGLDSWKWLGAITPLGGALLIISWTWAAYFFWRKDA